MTQTLALTVGDVEFFENTTGMAFTDFDAATQRMGTPLAVLAGIGLYRQGKAPDYESGVTAARELPFNEAIDIMTGLLAVGE